MCKYCTGEKKGRKKRRYRLCSDVSVFNVANHLNYLELINGSNLKKINISKESRLDSLIIINCKNLEDILSLQQSNLLFLLLYRCINIRSIPIIDTLEMLHINFNAGIVEINNYPKLLSLILIGCDKLQMITGNTFLYDMKLISCPELNNIKISKYLTELHLENLRIKKLIFPKDNKLKSLDLCHLEIKKLFISNSYYLHGIMLSELPKLKYISKINSEDVEIGLFKCDMLRSLSFENKWALYMSKCNNIMTIKHNKNGMRQTIQYHNFVNVKINREFSECPLLCEFINKFNITDKRYIIKMLKLYMIKNVIHIMIKYL